MIRPLTSRSELGMDLIKSIGKRVMQFGGALLLLDVVATLAWGLFSGFWLSGMGDDSNYAEIYSWMSTNKGATQVFYWILAAFFLGLGLLLAGGITYLIARMFSVRENGTVRRHNLKDTWGLAP